MSGGSYDYAYIRIEDWAARMADSGRTDARRASFCRLLLLVARAMHDIEWVDSCDSAPGDEHATIDAVFAFLTSDGQMAIKAAAFDELRRDMMRFLGSLDRLTHATPKTEEEFLAQLTHMAMTELPPGRGHSLLDLVARYQHRKKE